MVKHLAFASSLLPAAVASSDCSSLVVRVESNVVQYSTTHLRFCHGYFELLKPSHLHLASSKSRVREKSRQEKKPT